MATRREAELLAADRFARSLGITLVSATDDGVTVEMEVRPEHVTASGGLHPSVAFSVADCAMSLISNAETRAFAVSAHLVTGGSVGLGQRLRATATPAHREPGRVTWRVSVSNGESVLATFTGTTLEVPG